MTLRVVPKRAMPSSIGQCPVYLSKGTKLNLFSPDYLSDGFRLWVGGESGAGKSSAIMLVSEQVIQQPKAQLIMLDMHGEHGNLWGINPNNTTRFGYGKNAVDTGSVQWCLDEASQGRHLLVDLSHWADTYPAKVDEFVLSFMRELFKLRKDRPRWTLVGLEEAQNVLPQAQMSGQAENIRVLLAMMTGGRKFGVQFMLSSQQQSLVDVRAISACNTRLFLRVSSAKDFKQIRPYLSEDLDVGFKRGHLDVSKFGSGQALFMSRALPDSVIQLRLPETKVRKPLQDAMLEE